MKVRRSHDLFHMVGLMNLVPLQLGVLDVAFQGLNSISISVWLTATDALLVNVRLPVGAFARTGE
jgi:hypothetical protein